MYFDFSDLHFKTKGKSEVKNPLHSPPKKDTRRLNILFQLTVLILFSFVSK